MDVSKLGRFASPAVNILVLAVLSGVVVIGAVAWTPEPDDASCAVPDGAAQAADGEAEARAAVRKARKALARAEQAAVDNPSPATRKRVRDARAGLEQQLRRTRPWLAHAQ